MITKRPEEKGGKLGENQLTRMKEIFVPFFKVIETECDEFAFYMLNLRVVPNSRKPAIQFEFITSTESGTQKEVRMAYNLEENKTYIERVFHLTDAQEDRVSKAVEKVIWDLNGIPDKALKLNQALIEFGDKFKEGYLYWDDDYIEGGDGLLLKSNRIYKDYALDYTSYNFDFDKFN